MKEITKSRESEWFVTMAAIRSLFLEELELSDVPPSATKLFLENFQTVLSENSDTKTKINCVKEMRNCFSAKLDDFDHFTYIAGIRRTPPKNPSKELSALLQENE